MEDWELGFAEFVRGTVEAASRSWLSILLYILAFSAIGSATVFVDLSWLGDVTGETEALAPVQRLVGLGYGLAGLLIAVLTVIGQYFLWEAMLRKSGFGRGLGRHRYLAFIGQSVVIALGTALGFVLLIIPGLIFGARWMIAPAFLIKSEMGIGETMHRSWHAVRGNTTTVVLALLAGWGVILLIGVIIGGTSIFAVQVPGGNTAAALAAQAVNHFSTVLSIAAGVFLYGRVQGDSQELTEVFA